MYSFPYKLLKIFSKHKNRFWRVVAATSDKLSQRDLSQLLHDQSNIVRLGVVTNINVTPSILKQLTQDLIRIIAQAKLK